MIKLFRYNWEVRDEWFKLCEKLAQEELFQERSGGWGSIYKTLFHIIDVEYSWIRALNHKEDLEPDLKDYLKLADLVQLSRDSRAEAEEFFADRWSREIENQEVTVPWHDASCTYGEVLRHVIVHQVHHIGQLSVWCKDLGIENVSTSFVDRGII